MHTTHSAVLRQAQQLANRTHPLALPLSYRKGWLQAQKLLEQCQQQKLKKV